MKLLFQAALIVLAGAYTLHAVEKPAEQERKTDFDFTETVSVGGAVLAVTKDSILLSPEGQKPTTYPAHDRLAAGTVHKMAREARSYRLADVKAGDFVRLDTIVENKQTFCVAIQIWERPNGLVPAGQVDDKVNPYHKVRNADIAFRDKGTPVPEHLKPKFPK